MCRSRPGTKPSTNTSVPCGLLATGWTRPGSHLSQHGQARSLQVLHVVLHLLLAGVPRLGSDRPRRGWARPTTAGPAVHGVTWVAWGNTWQGGALSLGAALFRAGQCAEGAIMVEKWQAMPPANCTKQQPCTLPCTGRATSASVIIC